MPQNSKCEFCNAEHCLSTLGQYHLCASCRKQLLISALEFAKRNTTRGTVYHDVFEHLGTRLWEETNDM